MAGWTVSTQDNDMSHNVLKRNFGTAGSAKIQINLRIYTVWSESSPCTFWMLPSHISVTGNKLRVDYVLAPVNNYSGSALLTCREGSKKF